MIEIKQVLDVAACMFIVLDREGVLQMVNSKGCEVLGYEKELVEGLNWFLHFVPEEWREQRSREFQEFMKCGCDKQSRQSYILATNNDRRLINWNCTVLRDKNENIIGMLGSGEDITEKEDLRGMLALQEKEKRRLMVAAVIEAQEKERLHIASELHDNVGQILTTCKLLLEGETSKDSSPEILGHTLKHLQNAINEIRTISHQLNPAQLNEIGLLNALDELIKKINLSSRIRIQLNMENRSKFGELSATVSLALFRIVQEQLNNILRHADACNVAVNLMHSGKAVEMEIVDNGKGFRPAAVTKGLGLKNIHNRAELLNGKILIQSAPGEGCTLSVYIPLGYEIYSGG